MIVKYLCKTTHLTRITPSNFNQGNKPFNVFVELELHLSVPKWHTCRPAVLPELKAGLDRDKHKTSLGTNYIHPSTPLVSVVCMCNGHFEQSIDQFLRGKYVKK